jgi:predicted transcriptional regulator
VIETVTDMAGRHSGPTQKNWGAPLGDDHNLKLETKRRLIRQIAGHIQRLIERTGSDGCWIAAHKEINQQILEEFLGAQQESAAAQMKDLSHDLRVGEAFDKAFRLMQENAIPALPVVDRLGKLRGLITPENIGELMMMSSLLPKGGQPAWRGLAI